MENDILVSVMCLTHNHVDYIRDALEGILKQIVNFNYEVIVYDDASDDGTADILKEYKDKYPETFRIIYETENQYSKADNFVKLLHQKILLIAKGKYIMWCEGDDYWIDPMKMQMQIDYLERNSDCAMVVHNAIVLNMKKVIADAMTHYWKDKNLLAEDVINHTHGFIATATMAYRMKDFELKDFFNEAGIGDYTAQLYCLTRGNIYYIDRIMSVYRFGQKGSWQDSQAENKSIRFKHYANMIRFLDKYDNYTNYVFSQYINKEIYKYIDMTTDSNIEKNDMKEDGGAGSDYQIYLDEIVRLYRQINDSSFCGKETIEFITKYKHILIMGAGKYASILYKQLLNNQYSVDGFVVSPDRENQKLFLNRPVYKLDGIPYKNEETGILVGIHSGSWIEVEKTLLNNGINKYYNPFLFDRKRIVAT